jgi:hypothetical protein
MKEICVIFSYFWFLIGVVALIFGIVIRGTANSGCLNDKWIREDDEKDRVLGAKLIVFGLLFPVALPYLIIKNLPGVFKDAFRSKI